MNPVTVEMNMNQQAAYEAYCAMVDHIEKLVGLVEQARATDDETKIAEARARVARAQEAEEALHKVAYAVA